MQIEIRLKELLQIKLEEIEVEIVEMEIMPEQVHLFVKTKLVASPPVEEACTRAKGNRQIQIGIGWNA